MKVKDYKVGDRIFYEAYPNKEVCTDIVKRVKEDSYLNDKGKEIPYKWLTLWESGNCSSGIEDYNCLPYSDPRVKELFKSYKKFDKERGDIVSSILKILSPYGKPQIEEVIDMLKIEVGIKD